MKKYPIISVLCNFGLILLAFTLCRLAFLFSNYSYFSDLTFVELTRIFAGGIKFDISSLIYFNAIYIVLALLPFKFRDRKVYNKILKWAYFLPNSIALFLNCSDIIYYPFSLRRTTCMIFTEFGGDNNIAKIFATAIVEYWYITLFYVLIIFALNKLYSPIKNAKAPNNIIKYSISHIIILCISVYFCIIGIRGGFGVTTRPISIGNATEYCRKPSQAVLVLNTPFSLIHSVTKQPYPEVKYFTEEEVKEIFSPVQLGVRSEELGVKCTGSNISFTSCSLKYFTSGYGCLVTE